LFHVFEFTKKLQFVNEIKKEINDFRTAALKEDVG
jgi:hypothetical protein